MFDVADSFLLNCDTTYFQIHFIGFVAIKRCDKIYAIRILIRLDQYCLLIFSVIVTEKVRTHNDWTIILNVRANQFLYFSGRFTVNSIMSLRCRWYLLKWLPADVLLNCNCLHYTIGLTWCGHPVVVGLPLCVWNHSVTPIW